MNSQYTASYLNSMHGRSIWIIICIGLFAENTRLCSVMSLNLLPNQNRFRLACGIYLNNLQLALREHQKWPADDPWGNGIKLQVLHLGFLGDKIINLYYTRIQNCSSRCLRCTGEIKVFIAAPSKSLKTLRLSSRYRTPNWWSSIWTAYTTHCEWLLLKFIRSFPLTKL